MRCFIYLFFIVSILVFIGGCGDENSNATFGAHPTDWIDEHPGDIDFEAESFSSECGICHGLELQGSSGSPSCFTAGFRNSSCHANGPVSHAVGQAWLLPSGHVAAVDSSCISCHSLTGGGFDPACEDCHINNGGNDPILTGCVSCHSEPPNLESTAQDDRPNRQGSHNVHDSFTTTTFNCTACHDGGGTGEPSHYDRTDRSTPDYPADVNMLSGFDSNSHGAALYSGGICSGVNCHGGLPTPDWLTGSLDVDTQCTSCHQSGGITNELNSYSNPGTPSRTHDFHLAIDNPEVPGSDLITCTDCHYIDKLTNHFTNLGNPAQWLDTAGATVDGFETFIIEGFYDEVNKSCNPTCHGTEPWGN